MVTMPNEITAIFTKIVKPEGFADWSAEDQNKWLNDHFDEWLKSLSDEDRKKVFEFVRPQARAQHNRVIADFIQSIQQGILLEKTAEMSGEVQFTHPQKRKLREKMGLEPKSSNNDDSTDKD